MPDNDELVPVELTTLTYSLDEDGVTELGREVTDTTYVRQSQLDAAGFDSGTRP